MLGCEGCYSAGSKQCVGKLLPAADHPAPLPPLGCGPQKIRTVELDGKVIKLQIVSARLPMQPPALHAWGAPTGLGDAASQPLVAAQQKQKQKQKQRRHKPHSRR